MTGLTRWCFHRRYVVIGLWVAVLAALFGSSVAAGSGYSNAFNLPHTDSTKALSLLQGALPAQAGDADQVVVHVARGTIGNPAIQARITGMLTQVQALPSVAAVSSMYGAGASERVSRDGRTAYATVMFTAQADRLALPDIRRVIATAQGARQSGLQVELAGPAIDQALGTPPSTTEVFGIAAAAVILLIAFGSLLAMVLPLLIAVAALGAALLSVGLLAHLIKLSTTAPTLAALIGLGVGIDYALFIVTRHRAALQAGHPPQDAAVLAMNTSGRAVLFAGGTVVVALLGLLVLRVGFLGGLGVGAAVAVLWTVAAATTLLPAMLGAFGSRLLPRRGRPAAAPARAAAVPARAASSFSAGGGVAGSRPVAAALSGGAATDAAVGDGLWARWAALVARRKLILSAITLAVIAALAVPALSLRLGSSDAGNAAEAATTRQAYDLLATGFGPGSNGPLQLVAALTSPADSRALNALVNALRVTPGVAAVSAAPVQLGATLGIVTVVPTSSPQDKATTELITRIRKQTVPAAERGSTLRVYIGGPTATFGDFAAILVNKLPLFLAVIIGLGCLLLLVAFRSIVVPLTAALMNLLAAAASFGVVVAVFQWGWGASLIGIGKPGPVDAFVPVIMLAILFGLSMDYQVFLVSRMQEEWEHSHDNVRAVQVGQAITGRIITAAALIMMAVFASFIFGGNRVIAEFGVGLTAAVAIDAFLLRTVLVPALMHTFGPSNWWLPGWLDQRLPHLAVEPADPALPQQRRALETPSVPAGR